MSARLLLLFPSILAAGLLAGADSWAAASTTVSPGRGPQRAARFYDSNSHMAANNLDMFVTNYGTVARNPSTGQAGLIYPRGSTRTVVFAAGPWIGSLTNDTIRVAIGEYSQEFGPGTMQNGAPLPDEERFRNWQITRGNTSSFDYLNWPVLDGAPVDASGNAALSGDDMIWSVYNDADPSNHVANPGSTEPLGMEVRQSTYAFSRFGPLGYAIFMKFELRNAGFQALDGVHFTFWSDPDLGGFSDDLAGCDTTRDLGYCYNATNSDATYGSTPPAVGFDLLRGPVVTRFPGVTDTLGMTSFSKFINGTDPTSSVESYNYMQGLHPDGSALHENDNPFAPITTYQVSGDPVTGTGWLDTNPSDRRILVSSGPFTMNPGDTQEIVLAIIVGQGSDRLSSITDLKNKSDQIQALFDSGKLKFVTVASPGSKSVEEGQPLQFQVTATGPDGEAIALSADGLPLGASFTDAHDGSGTFLWTPAFNQAGDYTVSFTGQTTTMSDRVFTEIHVQNVNRAPVANAGGPYTGFINTLMTFDGSATSDPDGDALTYSWLFGDGDSGEGPTALHVYVQSGLFGVALLVSDGVLSDLGTTTASIVAILDARAFTSSGNKTIRLAKGKPTWCVQIEPVGRAYENTLVDLASLEMVSEGTGSVSRISATVGKTSIGVDRDGNGIEEVTACFRKEDLTALFGGLHGTSSVPVTLEGVVIGGGTFRAAMDVGVQAGSGGLSASVSPNPLNPSATLSIVTESAGLLHASLFDVSGRRVRTLLQPAIAPAGYHSVAIDGRDERGRPLSSGIYFYRIESAGKTLSGTVTILK